MAVTWYTQADTPDVGRAIIARTASGGYRQYLISDTTAQQEFATAPNIVSWAYAFDFMQNGARASKVLAGIKEGPDNDWTPTVNGFVQMEYDINMLKQQINGRIQTLPNEVDGFSGIDYLNVIFGDTSIQQKAAAFSEIIQNIPAVKDVTFINAAWVDKKSGVFRFTFQIQSIFGDLEFQIGIDGQNRTIINA